MEVGILDAPIVPRSPDGRLLPGGPSLNPHGTPRNEIADIRHKYRKRLPELFERLYAIATTSSSERTQISAISELLDRLIGKPQVTIDAVTTKVDVAALYLNAMKRANEAQVIDA